MVAVRDENVIFHGCVPVDGRASRSSFAVDGERAARASPLRRSGSRRAPRLPRAAHRGSGPPLLPLDRPALAPLRQGPDGHLRDVLRRRQGRAQGDQEPLLRADPRRRLLPSASRRSSAPPASALIVNGHVPVKLEAGESPVKRSGIGGDHRRRLLRGLRRPRLHPRHRRRAHLPGQAPPLRVGGGGHRARRRHRARGAGPARPPAPLRVADTARGAEESAKRSTCSATW